MNLREVKELIELVSEKGFAEFEIEHQGFRLHICRFKEPPVIQATPSPVIISSAVPVVPEPPAPVQSNPAQAAPAVAQTAKADAAVPEAQLHTIKSPIVGTFYRSPGPDKDPYVSEGSAVSPESTVCIVEAMKLMNEITSEVAGVVEKIYVENGQPVEFGQPLFGIKI